MVRLIAIWKEIGFINIWKEEELISIWKETEGWLTSARKVY